MKEDLFKAIIEKVLKGDATPHEKRMLANWLKEDPGREEIFYHCLLMHESESPQYFPEVDSKIEAYEKFMRGEIQIPKVDYHNEGSERSQSKIISYRWWLAASVLLFFSASLYFFKDSFLYKTYSAEYGMIKSVMLEDGSTVTLCANSSIKILRDFMDHDNREVWIKGEAFFEVSKKANRMKFIVHTDNLDVEVLGTKFNVNNRRGKTEVILAEGKVKLMAKDRAPLIMNPGEQVSLSNTQGNFQKHAVKTEAYGAWRKNMLVFEDTPLAEVAQVVQDYYGVKVIITDSLLATRQFTGTLPNNDLDVILLALKTSYKIEIEQSNEYIILK
ncbi:MAG TPA: FecR domain-containing protein [Chryseolinea sp.]|nr:FecR domain-containing protein [Chryseolinea sp.]